MSAKIQDTEHWAYLLLPALKLFHKEVVPLGNLAKLGVHAALEVNEILPCLEGIPRILISLADNLIEMSHGNFSHERFLNRSTEYSLHASISSL